MASPAVDLSHSITIAFTTSSFSAEITDVTPPASSRGSVDTSHQGTDTDRTFTPEDLVDNGECTFVIHFNPDTAPPVDGAAETVTITFPSGATWAFSGFMTNYEPGAPHLQKMTATVTVKVSGAITITAAV